MARFPWSTSLSHLNMAGCGRGDPGCEAAELLPRRHDSPRTRRRPHTVGLAALVLLLGGALALCSPAAAHESSLTTTSRSSDLTASNWTLLLQGEWMVKFFAPWCSACQQIQAQWEKFAQSGMELNITVGKVDVTQETGLSGRFFVTTLPTIFHAKDGVFRKYRGSRTLEDLRNYIIFKKWEGVEPISSWKSPSSITMYGMSGLFHLSGWIRQIHNYLTGPLGIPVWGSYLIFILAVLVIGLVLGLMLVLLADCICPPKPRYRVERSADVNEKETVEISDEEQEEEEEEEEEEQEEQEQALEEKKEAGDAEDEGNNGSDRALGEESAGEDGSKSREQGEEGPAEPEAESSLRQRKMPATENGQ